MITDRESLKHSRSLSRSQVSKSKHDISKIMITALLRGFKVKQACESVLLSSDVFVVCLYR